MYIAIDLKSFYASVECMDLGYDPLTTHLVVADESRSAKTMSVGLKRTVTAPFSVYSRTPESNCKFGICQALLIRRA